MMPWYSSASSIFVYVGETEEIRKSLGILNMKLLVFKEEIKYCSTAFFVAFSLTYCVQEELFLLLFQSTDIKDIKQYNKVGMMNRSFCTGIF